MKLGLQLGLGPCHIVLDENPASLPQRGTDPNFRLMSVVAKRLDGWEVGLNPGHIVLDGDPPPLPRVAQPPILGPCMVSPMSIVAKRSPISAIAEHL